MAFADVGVGDQLVSAPAAVVEVELAEALEVSAGDEDRTADADIVLLVDAFRAGS